ncbi:MAG: D-cysteine desulfhydrase family protein [Candidatus Bipolaricaulota bacterium]
MKRRRLAVLPTPLQELTVLSRELGGPRLFVKRDDLTGLGLGGNKLRKLEYAMAEAEEAGATCVITSGAVQSNHTRLTAAACRLLGFPCHLVLAGDKPDQLTGNLLLDSLLGVVSVRFVPRSIEGKEAPGGPTPAHLAVEELRSELEQKGERPYVIPNGCRPLHGALGYAPCVREIAVQLHELNLAPHWLVTATGTSSTQGGLILGSELYCGGEPRVIGISVSRDSERLTRRISKGLDEAYAFLGRLEPEHDILIHDEYVGPGYGVPTSEMVEAVKLTARLEGLILDPVYTGKTMAGVIDLARQGAFQSGDVVVFLHTGGIPGLFTTEQAAAFTDGR